MVARARQQIGSAGIWPGFVDAISTLLLVLIFLLVVFVLSEYFLGRALSGRDVALQRLEQRTVTLDEMLTLEKQANVQLRGDFSQLAGELRASTGARDALIAALAEAEGQNLTLSTEFDSASSGVDGLRARVAELDGQLEAALALLEAERALVDDAYARGADTGERLDVEIERSASTERQAQALGERLDLMHMQLSSLQAALDARDLEVGSRDVEIAELGEKLALALAKEVEELSQVRSEFFARLREVLADRSEVSIEGDRFVIPSGVLFDSGSAQLGIEGQRQMATLAELLLEITGALPGEVDWILRIDGHTDNRPIATVAFPSNWELSTARAVAVLKALVARGVPSERLAATGFGEYQPLDTAANDDAYRRNRRIELKLTDR